MSTSRLKHHAPQIPVLVASLTACIVIAIPFHAFLTVWLSSIVGHYTVLRLWKEIVLLVAAVPVLYLLAKDAKLRQQLLANRLNQLIAAYCLLTVVWGVGAFWLEKVTAKSLAYGLIVNLRFLGFYLIAWVAARSLPKKICTGWPSWLFWPLTVVVAVGLLQYFVLPYDFLQHFGYGTATIFPYETINHDITHLRVFSTLRGANPLGAYLVLVLSLLAICWYRQRQKWQLGLFVAGSAVLFLSFSRSAWIGLFLSLAVIGWVSLRSDRARRTSLIATAGALLVLGLVGFALRHNTTLQDYAFHTNEKSTIATSSNDGHLAALKSGAHDVATEPLGRGPGSAGPASVYNHDQVRIAENYFIQVGQETGWLGLVLCILIQAYLAVELWRRRRATLALGLFAALIGLTFVNLLSHAWTDDTLAYLFWGLAGVSLAIDPVLASKSKVK